MVNVCNYHVRREFPGKFESRNLSRDNLSREIGRMPYVPSCTLMRVYSYCCRDYGLLSHYLHNVMLQVCVVGIPHFSQLPQDATPISNRACDASGAHVDQLPCSGLGNLQGPKGFKEPNATMNSQKESWHVHLLDTSAERNSAPLRSLPSGAC